MIQTVTEVQQFIEDTFSSIFPEVSYDEIEYSVFTGSNTLACVSRSLIESESGKFFKNGKRHKKNPYSVKLSISERLLNCNSIERQSAVLYHEFAHILQYSWLTDQQINDFRASERKSHWLNSFTSYNTNMLELHAEAFALTYYGRACHGKNTVNYHAAQEIMEIFWEVSPWEA